MFEHGVRPQFWLSLIVAFIILGVLFVVGWAGVSLFAFAVFPPLGMLAVIGYPFLVLLFAVGYLLSLDHLGGLGVGSIKWINVSHPFVERLAFLASRVHVEVPRFGVATDVDIINAFTYGIFEPKVVVSRGCLENLSEDELDFVVAHELGHIKYKWVWILYSISTSLFTLPMVMPTLVYAIMLLVSIPAKFALYWFSRECEYLADREALFAIGNLRAAVTALVKMELQLGEKGYNKTVKDVLTVDEYERIVEFTRTHPNTGRRIWELVKVYREYNMGSELEGFSLL